ncbi:hypothetical protein ALP71_200039 [Pseudomonas coronafaciens pv. garcae]|nr:hypothetical protein ALP71_200039 [Pseudomonas coronafaciens pv. garcae]
MERPEANLARFSRLCKLFWESSRVQLLILMRFALSERPVDDMGSTIGSRKFSA